MTDVHAILQGTEVFFRLDTDSEDHCLSICVNSVSNQALISDGLYIWRFCKLNSPGVRQRLLASLRQNSLKVSGWADYSHTISATSPTLLSPILFDMLKGEEAQTCLQRFFSKLVQHFSIASEELRRLNKFSAVESQEPPSQISEAAMKKISAKKPGMSAVNPSVKKRKQAVGLHYDESD